MTGRNPLRRLKEGLLQVVRRLGARAYPLLAAVFSLVIVADLGLLNMLNAAETRLFDLLIANRVITPKPDPDIVIIDIDEASLAALSPELGPWRWPHRVFGELVDGLEAQKPRAIVFDVLFADADSLRPDSDAAFNAAIARSKTTFFPILRLDPRNDHLSKIPAGAIPGVRPLGRATADGDARIAVILPRVPAAIDNGRLGTHQVEPDKGGVIRRYPAWLEYAGWRIPSLPQRLAEEFDWPGADKRNVLLNWRGPPFTYRYVSFVDVYRGFKNGKPPIDFAGKIVLIGSTAPALFDVKGTPMARIHPGVEILATAVDNFKHGDWLRERPKWVLVAAALLLVWSMAIALYRQIRIETFDTVFGVLQAGLVVIAFAVLNLSDWYLDTSAPLSLGLMYFTVARLYHGASLDWLAGSQFRHVAEKPAGRLTLAALAIQLDQSRPAEQRRLKGEIDRQVARSRLGAGRIAHLIEEPGFVQGVFADTMMVYWLLEGADGAADEAWPDEADAIEAALLDAGNRRGWRARLVFFRAAGRLEWDHGGNWKTPARQIILRALQGVSTSAATSTSKDRP